MPESCCGGCGSYRLLPHCLNPSCPILWCPRGECGWTNGAECDSSWHPATAERLDRADGVTKRRYKGVTSVGGFGRSPDGHPRPYGWSFAEGPEPDWLVSDLLAMWQHFEHIKALPSALAPG